MKFVRGLLVTLLAGLCLTSLNTKGNATDKSDNKIRLTVVNDRNVGAGWAKIHSGNDTYALDKAGLIKHTSYSQSFDVKGQLPTEYKAQFYYAFPHQLVNCSRKFDTPPMHVRAIAQDDASTPNTYGYGHCYITGE